MRNIESFWSSVHANSDIRFLSGYPGQDIWTALRINELVVPNAKVLNIGVGTGRCSRDLFYRGAAVSVLDICTEALDKVSDFAEGFLAENIKDLPTNYFDLAISHLVAQHMNDSALEVQMRWVIRSLKQTTGVFALQYLSKYEPKTESSDMLGTNCRDFSWVSSCVKKCGGYIHEVPPSRKFNGVVLDSVPVDAVWEFVHIKKV